MTRECFGNDLGFLLRPNRSHTALGRISEDIIGINHALSKSSSEEYEKDLGFPYAQNIPIIVWEGFWISQKLLEEDEKLSKRS